MSKSSLDALSGLVRKLSKAVASPASAPHGRLIGDVTRIKLLLEGDATSGRSGSFVGRSEMLLASASRGYIDSFSSECRMRWEIGEKLLNVAMASADPSRILAASSGQTQIAARCAIGAINFEISPLGLNAEDWVTRTALFLYESSRMSLEPSPAQQARAKQYLQWASSNGSKQAADLLAKYFADEQSANSRQSSRGDIAHRLKADELFKAFESNEALFYKTYGGKTVEVQGSTLSVGNDRVRIDTNPAEKDAWRRGMSSAMSCQPNVTKEKMLELTKGAPVTVVGVVYRDDAMGSLSWGFKNCEIVATR